MRSRPPFTGVLRGPGLKVPHGVLFEQFSAPASECPKECFWSVFLSLAQKGQKTLQKALFGALRGRGPKLLKKHCVGHFQARAPEHSCKWRPGSQNYQVGIGNPGINSQTIKVGSGTTLTLQSLLFFDFLAFFVFRFSLLFGGVFPLFSKDFGRSAKEKNPCFFSEFTCKKARVGGSGPDNKSR